MAEQFTFTIHVSITARNRKSAVAKLIRGLWRGRATMPNPTVAARAVGSDSGSFYAACYVPDGTADANKMTEAGVKFSDPTTRD